MIRSRQKAAFDFEKLFACGSATPRCRHPGESRGPGSKSVEPPPAALNCIIAGGSAPAPWGRFLCARKEIDERNAPRSLRRAKYTRFPARLALAGHSPNSPGVCTRGAPIRGAPVRRHGSPPDFHEYSASPSGSIKSLANTPGLARCSARDDGG
jgi:hypothetical protein